MSSWRSIIETLAPTIASALGGPLASGAVRYLSAKLLGREDASEEELAKAIAGASPSDLAKLRKIDADFKVEMERVGVDIFALVVSDRKSARDLAKINMLPQIILSTVFILGYFVLVFILFSGQIKIDDSIRDMSNVLIGVITANVPSIMQFWFGSSHGSKQKTEDIKNAKNSK